MRIFNTALGFLLTTHVLLGVSPALHAQTAFASFGVTVVLRTFSEAVTADHRCTHRGQAEGQKGTLRISCPSAVDVQATASASSRKAEALQRMNAATGQPEQASLAVVAGKPMKSAGPVELTISW
jgi:hypothetical protein